MKYGLYQYKNHSVEKERIDFQNTRIDHYIVKSTKPTKKKARTNFYKNFIDIHPKWWNHPDKDRWDYQRQKVYDSERASVSKMSKKFASYEEACRFIAKVINSDWFQQHFSIRTVSVTTTLREDVSARGHRAKYNKQELSRIIIPKWGLTARLILHEIAHTLTKRVEGSGHGRKFCFIYLKLVEKYMSKDAAAALEKEFKKRNVDYWKFGRMAEHVQDDYCPF